MAWFRRKKSDDLAQEFKDYYQGGAQSTQRSGLAWILALVTLVCSVFLVIALFLGGRWIYRKVTDKQPETTQTVNPGVGGTNQPTTNPTPQPAAPTPTPPATTPTPPPATTPPTTNGQNGQTATPTPPSSLPSTGPELDL